MPSLTFFKCSPGGNPTLLLIDTGLTPQQQAHVGGVLLDPLHLYAEQVGFIDLPKASLRMAGGEFCVNASRSLGAVLAVQGLLPARDDGTLHAMLSVSGLDAPVQIEVAPPRKGQSFSQRVVQSAALVPLPVGTDCVPLADGIMQVSLPGITHVLIDAAKHPLSPDGKKDAAALRQRFALEQHAAVGCIWWQHADDPLAGQCLRMQPIVWVRSLQSACLESSCGSGAMACALMLQKMLQKAAQNPQNSPLQEQESHYTLLQPSGTALSVSYLQRQQVEYVRVSGPVSIIAEGTVYVDSVDPQE